MSHHPEKHYPYRNPKPLTRWLHYTIYGNILLAIIGMTITFITLYCLKQQETHPGTLPQPYSVFSEFMNEQGNCLLLTTSIALTIATAFILFKWLYRSNANLRAFAVKKLQFTPRGTVYWWFIPVANLIAPIPVMEELWRNSLNLVHNPKNQYGEIIIVWWTCFISPKILDLIGRSIANDEHQQITLVLTFGSIAIILYLISALTLIKITRTISDAQAEYHAQIQTSE